MEAILTNFLSISILTVKLECLQSHENNYIYNKMKNIFFYLFSTQFNQQDQALTDFQTSPLLIRQQQRNRQSSFDLKIRHEASLQPRHLLHHQQPQQQPQHPVLHLLLWRHRLIQMDSAARLFTIQTLSHHHSSVSRGQDNHSNSPLLNSISSQPHLQQQQVSSVSSQHRQHNSVNLTNSKHNNSNSNNDSNNNLSLSSTTTTITTTRPPGSWSVQVLRSARVPTWPRGPSCSRPSSPSFPGLNLNEPSVPSPAEAIQPRPLPKFPIRPITDSQGPNSGASFLCRNVVR